LGVVSSAKQLRYIGFDIELRTAEANQKMAEALGVADRASCGRADLLDEGSWEPADLLLCGPPYYDCENYGDSSTTALRQLSYEEWVELFIGQLFRKGAHVPCIVLNVGTFLLKGTRKDYPEDVAREAQKHGFVLADRWEWKQASFGKSSRTEALLVFRRA
jgi:hypothetical protein